MSELMQKHEMTEEDIKLQFITPAIEAAGWDKFKQIKLEYNFTDGRVIVRGNVTARGKRKRTDYLLYYRPNLPLAIVEAKDNKHSIGAGMQQGIEYAECLDVPFVYSSNGDGFLEHDMKTGKEREISLDEFPSPEDLWMRYKNIEQITPDQEKLIKEVNSGAYWFCIEETKRHDIIRELPSIVLLTLSPVARTVSYSLWPLVQAKHTRLSRSFTDSGNPAPSVKFFSLLIEMFWWIRPCNRILNPSLES